MPVDDLKRKTVRGGIFTLVARVLNMVLRMGFLVVLARLLLPEDFGLVGMVTAVTGVLALLKDAGLSSVTVQRTSISNEQISTLFWLNIAIGFLLCGVCLAAAPIMVSFYKDDRLFWVTVALSTSFVFNAASVQHAALLQRHLRYIAMAAIEIISLLIGITVGIVMALRGFTYWSLVGSTIAQPAVDWYVCGLQRSGFQGCRIGMLELARCSILEVL